MMITMLPTVGTLLPTPVASVWGAFLYEGLTEPEDRMRWSKKEILSRWGKGQIELVQEITQLLDIVWGVAAEMFSQSDLNFAGVFEYGVVAKLGEDLGVYIMNNKSDLPSHAVFSTMVTQRISAFLLNEDRRAAFARIAADEEGVPEPVFKTQTRYS